MIHVIFLGSVYVLDLGSAEKVSNLILDQARTNRINFITTKSPLLKNQVSKIKETLNRRVLILSVP